MSLWTNETAEWYAEKYGEYATNQLGIDGLDLLETSSIVDIGCGTGCALRHAARVVTKGTLIGIDPVPRMIEIAKAQTTTHEAAQRIVYYVATAEDLPVQDNSADFVFAFDSYDHWQDQTLGLQEVCRVLKPDGRFVVVKDSGVPHNTEAKTRFIQALDVAGIEIAEEETLEAGSVKCTRWVCVIR